MYHITLAEVGSGVAVAQYIQKRPEITTLRSCADPLNMLIEKRELERSDVHTYD